MFRLRLHMLPKEPCLLRSPTVAYMLGDVRRGDDDDSCGDSTGDSSGELCMKDVRRLLIIYRAEIPGGGSLVCCGNVVASGE
jgi:hypothetical protein